MATMTVDETVLFPSVTTTKEDSMIKVQPLKAELPHRPHAEPTMMGISPELRLEICEYLRPKDLLNVCLTSKTMQQAAVKPLYRDIWLAVTKEKAINKVASMLSRENPGIDHIQSCQLIDWCEKSKSSCPHSPASGYSAARYVINSLPKDKLHSFSWDSTHAFTVDLAVLLLKRQKNLRHVELHSVNHKEGPCFADVFKKDQSLLKSVEKADSLHFEPNCLTCVEAAKMMLDSCRPPKKIKISAASLDDEERLTTTNDEGETNDPLFNALFSNFLLPDVKPLRLTNLTLEMVDLTQCKTTYANVMSFDLLKKLRIRNCWRPDLFLDSMMYPKDGMAMHLKELILTHTEESDERFITGAVDRFLGHNKGLTNLHLYLQNEGTLPTLEKLLRHGSTLEKLYLCVRKSPRDPEGQFVSYTAPDQLSTLCHVMPKLKQLALSIEDWPASLDCKFQKDRESFASKILQPLAKLPALQTLNVLNWPQIGCGCSCLDMRDKTYRALCRTQATKFFRLFKDAQAVAFAPPPPPSSPDVGTPATPPDSLKVLAFGEHPDFTNRLPGLSDKDQKDYLRRGIFLRVQGRESWSDKLDSPLAVAIWNAELQGLDVEADVLNNCFKFRPSACAGDDW
ncbi:hypothetical protein M501DRAFT_1013105 [Patellaria atrata CBS 101060]|uniref:F-box domain-containing protein n=1 Tax=Patellaria atrata CBS 101060 TaxID=1346257 RepID=A0A9P4SK67_9PEZI|nr:hypothetical protein M501DRAFT_1013105 [Patellaria atrata CBS 101060]